MHRRRFLACLGGGALALGGCRFLPEDGLRSSCRTGPLPEALAAHPLMTGIWQGIDPARLWDCHVHLIGVGDGGSGTWINPKMDSWLHPMQYVQKRFYWNAACLGDHRPADPAFVARLTHLADQFPRGARFMLLAFDRHHDEHGRPVEALTPFHTPNGYARDVARAHPERFEWIASVHPYRADALDALEQAAAEGARAVKWLPPAMGMDPGSPRCDRFFEALARLGLPLLSHAGHELAVQADAHQALGNPLRLRRALEHGVTVILAHCASLGENVDLDAGPNGPVTSNFALFTRLMDETRHRGRLYGEISATGQLLRSGPELDAMIARRDWQERLLYGSDYPLPAITVLFSTRDLRNRGYLTADEREFLLAVRRENPLLFDFALKRLLTARATRFAPDVFHTRRVFELRGATEP
jgi:mannonate dehydratase